ncbi:MAG: DUF3025 domain-containing protein [Burkholderiaceae bacterium]|nr:DUF3025 domain-containing protein [Burkholderiaceae bacterium]MCD8536247.1 DUF3025 domain-containing protein [Burkholderiaceae bacterium]MCD8565984.1 DUF3025 domain-containing protein [Burkholderiaceae bacterium]
MSNQFQTLTESAPALWVGLQHTLAKFPNTPDIAALNLAALDAGITNALGLPIQFIAQTAPCGQRDYEAQIYHHGLVATRPGHLHDIFNACMWLTYPKTKAAVNAVHLRQPSSKGRTAASDAATIFDESGAVLIGPDPRLARWLIDHEWKTAFVTHRDLWRTHHLLVIGHAVLEKLAVPYPGMIVKAIYQPWPAMSKDDLMAPPTELDQLIAKRWDAGEFSRPAHLFPMPVLGVPDTDPGNEDPAYYDNTMVFRVKRRQ